MKTTPKKPDNTDYENAWKEGEDGVVADAVQTAAKKKAEADQDEFLKAFVEDEEKDQ